MGIKNILKKDDGFSIIELSIYLIILGIVVGTVSGPIIALYKQYQYKKTLENQEIIVRQIAFFLSVKGGIPCPSNPQNPTVMVMVSKQAKTFGMMVGVVPFRQLGIDEKVAKDGYGRWFTYIINPYSASTWGDTNSNRLCNRFLTENKQTLIVKDKNGDKLKDISFVIISHGPSGRGAFINSGAKIPCTKNDSQYKHDNCDDNINCVYIAKQYTEGEFDDIVRSVSILELLSMAGVKCIDDLPKKESKSPFLK